MIHPDDFICPVCGLICSSLHAYRQHWEKKHRKDVQACYTNGCPILDEEGRRP